MNARGMTMMTKSGEIEKAVDRYGQRKDALEEGIERDIQQPFGPDVMRILLTGLDIDIDELDHFRIMAVAAALRAAAKHGQSIEELIAASWVDGLVTGVLLGESRDS